MNILNKIEGYLESSINENLDTFKTMVNAAFKKAGSNLKYDDADPVKYQKLFKKLNKKDAQNLLDAAIKAKEFHPDRIKQYQNIIDKNVNEATEDIINEKDMSKEAAAFLKGIKGDIDKAISELESGSFGTAKSVTPSLIGKLAGVHQENWYRNLFK